MRTFAVMMNAQVSPTKQSIPPNHHIIHHSDYYSYDPTNIYVRVLPYMRYYSMLSIVRLLLTFLVTFSLELNQLINISSASSDMHQDFGSFPDSAIVIRAQHGALWMDDCAV